MFSMQIHLEDFVKSNFSLDFFFRFCRNEVQECNYVIVLNTEDLFASPYEEAWRQVEVSCADKMDL